MSLNSAQLRLDLGKLKSTSSAVSDGTVIRPQCPDQIVAWVITSFLQYPLQCNVGIRAP